MHRATPYDINFRGYSSGGARSLVDNIADEHLMQEATDSQGMKGESWPTCEAPQNYGFTSVVADARKSSNPGEIQQCAEGFMSFIGGNRNFPVMASMDDRRHRLINLAKDAAKGAAAMFGLKEWGQQFLNTEDGMFMTGNSQKKIRTALVDNQNGQTQQSTSGASGKAAALSIPGAVRRADGRIVIRSKSGVEFDVEEFIIEPRASGGSGGGSGGSSGGSSNSDGSQGSSKPTGQKTLHKEDSSTWHELNNNYQQLVRGSGNVKIEDGQTQTYHSDPSTSTRCDDSHVHIRKGGMKIWVDKGGCHATVPITITSCPDDDNSGGGGGSVSGGPAPAAERFYIYPPQPTPYDVTSSSPPIDITGGVVSMDYQAPIALGTGPTPPLILNYAPPLMLDATQRLAIGPLSLDGGTF